MQVRQDPWYEDTPAGVSLEQGMGKNQRGTEAPAGNPFQPEPGNTGQQLGFVALIMIFRIVCLQEIHRVFTFAFTRHDG